jgi:hypothetical protein
MPAVQLVGAIGQHQERRTAQVTNQESEEVQGRTIGPMQILDHERRRGPFRQPLQKSKKRLEQPRLGRRANAGRGWLRLVRLIGRCKLRQQPC